MSVGQKQTLGYRGQPWTDLHQALEVFIIFREKSVVHARQV